MKICIFGYSSFAAKDLSKDFKKNPNVIFFSRKKNIGQNYFDLTKKNKILYKKLYGRYIVVFFASYVPKNEYINNWSKVTKINIDGIINFISSLKKKPEKIIFISSCSVYGENDKFNFENLLRPLTPYSISKLAQENILRIFCKKYKVNLTILRLGYVFGPSMSKKRLLKRMKIKLKNKKNLNLYNKNLNLNLIHTEDIKNVIKICVRKKNSSNFNVVNKKKITLLHYVNALKKKKIKYTSLKKNEYFLNNFNNSFKKFKFKKIEESINDL